ncbi:hypothetical protein OS493_007740 [Desmophyllum pertusum]|uniref:Uncharacterized protein n=1 Tax=Desmophyllum pertusum TaxID=174260 RepID=A0A9W9YUJ6_9CNID|nr:hypothetical protein OS493_007740 [Desmophyllum pertusum]
MASVQPEESRLSPYRKLLLKLSSDLTSNDLERILAFCRICLKQLEGWILPGRYSFKTEAVKVETDGYRDDIVTDGVDDNTEKDPAIPGSSGTSTGYRDDIVTDGVGDNTENDPAIPGSSGTSTGYRDDIVTDGVGDNTENDPPIPGSSGTSTAEIGQSRCSIYICPTSFVSHCCTMQMMVVLLQPSMPRVLSGDQGPAQISQCFAVLYSDTSSDGNNGSSSGLTGPSPCRD